MALTDEFFPHDPASITINREDRQRKLVEVNDLKESILRIGQLNPIIITREGVLIAGERRLKACQELGLNVMCRYFDTLSPKEASIVELEENLKRKNLPWQDMINATGKIHAFYLEDHPGWTQTDTAAQLSIPPTIISEMLLVHTNLTRENVISAPSWRGAYNAIMKEHTRKADKVLVELMETSKKVFSTTSTPQPTTPSSAGPIPQPAPEPAVTNVVLEADFNKWAAEYTGPRFNLIHCDFPYGIGVFDGKIGAASQLGLYIDNSETYTELLATLKTNIEKLLTDNGHILFWFSMKTYEFTRTTLQSMGLNVNPQPLIWVKSDNAGIAPNPKQDPRNTYETALLAHRGTRPILSPKSNCISAPTDKSLHPSAKPIPVLTHFLSMLVDDTTKILDPTAGSGGALIVADALGANTIVGLELDPTHVSTANIAFRKARIIRRD